MNAAVAISPLHDNNAFGHAIAATISNYLQTAVHALPSKSSNDFVRNDADLNHLPSPLLQNEAPSFSPQQYGEDDVPQSIGTNPKTFGTSGDPKSETRTSLHRALTLHVSDPAKIVARKTGASVDTIDNHRAGNVPQSWTQMIAYCRAYPAFALDVVEMMGLDIDRDREAYALFLSLQRQMRGGR